MRPFAELAMAAASSCGSSAYGRAWRAAGPIRDRFFGSFSLHLVYQAGDALDAQADVHAVGQKTTRSTSS